LGAEEYAEFSSPAIIATQSAINKKMGSCDMFALIFILVVVGCFGILFEAIERVI
jgi:hypothetical protein